MNEVPFKDGDHVLAYPRGGYPPRLCVMHTAWLWALKNGNPNDTYIADVYYPSELFTLLRGNPYDNQSL